MSTRDRLEKLAEYVLKSGDALEEPLDAIEELLKSSPSDISFFIDLFDKEQDKDNKEVLATIIIEHVPNQQAIRFLRDVQGWSIEDFEGYTAAEGYFKGM